MDGYYNEDPNELYDPYENMLHFTQEGCDGQMGSYASNDRDIGDFYDDLDLEYEGHFYPDYPVQTRTAASMIPRMQHHGLENPPIFGGHSNIQGAQPNGIALQQPCHGRNSTILEETRTYHADDNSKRKSQVKLRPVTDLPDKYRSLFKFGVFNAVQSACFNEVFNDEKNLVISAPTGSGKTVIFELAMIQTLEKGLVIGKPAKCIYVAPTKALCMEKFQDWTAKFEPLGFKCSQLTGDTVGFGADAWGDAKISSIIVTTCEKWDSLTRNWNDYGHILSQIELFLVDEVHILNDTRGSTLEVVTSRMKLRRPTVRFILVSATVPNIRDVAEWIGCGTGTQEPAMVFEFGDDYRPCKLTRHIVGIPKKNGMNEFQFAKFLDYKLFSTLQQFSVGKPILVFCPTRKGVFGTAEQLMKEYIDTEAKKTNLPWTRPARFNHTFSDKRLNEFASVGIGVHHAGLTLDDRRATEQMYLDKILRILIATSTLAVGVNLPAHMVVIKGVHTYQNNASKEYSDLDVMQMLGRAGRPQFDTNGIAVIMCEAQLESKYRELAQGRTVLESSLHLNLAEHLNSEIGLGTISNIALAKKWLRSSFLFQRIQRNPSHYAIATGENYTTIVDGLVLESIQQLERTQLVQTDSKISGDLSSTQFGEIMILHPACDDGTNPELTRARHFERNGALLMSEATPSILSAISQLEVICGAEEFRDCKLRASEKPLYNKLRRDIDIRFEVKKVENTSDKIFILLQAVLGGISLNSPEYKATESQPHLEAFTIFKHIARIARAALDVAVVKKCGAQVKNGLELFRCLTAKAWEDRAVVLRQIEHLGEKSIKVLAEHGITSLAQLRKQDPLTIETLLNRRPPFGLEVLASVLDLPQYTLVVQEVEVRSGAGNPVEVRLRIECSIVEARNTAVKPKKSRSRNFDRTAVLTVTSDMDFIDFRRIPSKALRGGKSFELDFDLKKPSQSVLIIITSETIAGVACQQVYKPKIPPNEYPTLDTRPISSIELDLIGLENDPEFWNMTLDSDSPKHNPIEEKPEASMNPKHISGEPAKRSDNRYECNHTCKDKKKCRHLCCRDGLPHPPTKKNSQPSQNLQPASKAKQQSKLTRTRMSPEDSGNDKDSRQMVLTYERATAQNITTPSGRQQRLKITSCPTTKQKRRPPVDYAIHFTDLKDPQATTSDFPDSISDEDLPAAIIPLGESNKRKCDHAKQSDIDQPPGKRLRKNLHISASPQQSVSGSPNSSKRYHEQSPHQEIPLFLLDSSDEGSIEVSSPVPAVMTARQGENKESSRSWLAKRTFLDLSEATDQPEELAVLNTNLREESASEPKNEMMDEFAELQAWLNSGVLEVF